MFLKEAAHGAFLTGVSWRTSLPAKPELWPLPQTTAEKTHKYTFAQKGYSLSEVFPTRPFLLGASTTPWPPPNSAPDCSAAFLTTCLTQGTRGICYVCTPKAQEPPAALLSAEMLQGWGRLGDSAVMGLTAVGVRESGPCQALCRQLGAWSLLWILSLSLSKINKH